MSRKQLTRDEVLTLRGFKGQTNAQEKFFNYLRDIYESDEDVLEEIDRMEEMQKSVDDIQFPAAQEKTRHMFYQYMDEFNASIGFTTKD